MPFGVPVVPDENSTHSGWANGTGVISSGASVSSTRDHRDHIAVDLQSPAGAPDGRLQGRQLARISASSVRRSCRFPPYTEPSLATSTVGSS